MAESIVDTSFKDFKEKKASSYTSNGKGASVVSCQHIVSCGNHHPTETYPVEARNTTTKYNARKSGAYYSGSKHATYAKTEQSIQTTPIAHQRGRKTTDTLALIGSGSLADASRIQQLINTIQAEITARGKTYTAVTQPSAGTQTQAEIIRKINNLFVEANLGRPSGARDPYSGDLMEASKDPNPAITKINALLKECICYSDCSNFSVCSCYSHCNNY